MSKLTHLDEQGRAAMVDVSEKPVTTRVARAGATLAMKPETLALLKSGNAPKGDVLATARIAGIQAAKRTPDLIPLCHALAISKVEVHFNDRLEGPNAFVDIETRVKCSGQTGVEMEALCAATVAALTLYDMLKAVEKTMRVENVRVLEKQGGRSGHFVAETSST